MSIYRTLKQAEMLRDHSNHTLRFNRTMPGGWRRDRPTPAGYFVIGYIAILGALMLALI